MDVWKELGIAPTRDRGEVRRAYARRLKAVNPEDDPAGFQRLRSAYEKIMASVDTAEGESDTPRTQDSEDEDPELLEGLLHEVNADLDKEEGADAIKRFDTYLHSADMNLEKRALIEQRLLEEIAQRHSVPERFARFATDTFRWDQGLGHLPRYHRAVARDLLAIPETNARLKELKQRARGWFWKLARALDSDSLAAALLLSRIRPLWFRLAAFDLSTLQAVQRLFGELDSFYPGLVTGRLDAETVRWWRRELQWQRGRKQTVLRIIVRTYWAPMIAGLVAFVALLLLPDPPPWHVALFIGVIVMGFVALPLTMVAFKESITKFVLWIMAQSARAAAAGFVIVAGLFVWYLFEEPPFSYVVAGAAFLTAIIMAGQRDRAKFFLGCVALWGALGLSAFLWPRLTTVIAPDVYFWVIQVAVFAALKSWRLMEQHRIG